LVAILLFFSSCNSTHKSSGETSAPFDSTTTTLSEIAIVYYPPEYIKLVPDSELAMDWGKEIPKYRAIYYNTGNVDELIDPVRRETSEIDNLMDAIHYIDGEYDTGEMRLVTMLKHFNISKEDFEKVLKESWQESIEYNISHGWEIGSEIILDEEGWEYPNPDILYTFDNEIINAYYRRDNPVAPEPGTYTTYGSYEEYLKAQP